ncbi:DUF4439 domain-containing protein [Tersicoccus sp. Bi-70]|uniref:DUF4439 domain-containing protein n=1 Tax=Tersicoccus sp. Bi-70 TaxID=1897634 RepID=UPI0009755974|nr:DUF4439 domain-containing protein [Tersicoccus sp. Bi-70]OMH31208.1 hypothetical protein BGP79_09150 [Tersicoccus sp. Bi-70]
MGARDRAGSPTPSRGSRKRPWLLVVAGVALFALVAVFSAAVVRPLLMPGTPGSPTRIQAENARRAASTALARLDDDVRVLLRRGGTTPTVRTDLAGIAAAITVQRRLLAGDDGPPPGAATATGGGAPGALPTSDGAAGGDPTTTGAARAVPSGAGPSGAGPSGSVPSGSGGSGAASAATARPVTAATVARDLQDAGVRSLTDAAVLGSPAPASAASTSATSASAATGGGTSGSLRGDAATGPATTPPVPASTAASSASSSLPSSTSSSSDAASTSAWSTAPEGGMARVLAATGAAQVQWADRLARSAGIALSDATSRIRSGIPADQPSSCPSPASGTSRSSTGSPSIGATPGSPSPTSSSPRSSSPSPSPSPSSTASTAVPGPAEALSRVALAEQRAAYTWEVLRARTDDGLPAATAAEHAHRTRLAVVTGFARDHCRAVEPERPAFPVDRTVLDQPTRATAATARLEQDTVLAWGDVIAFSDAALRARAVPLLLDAARARTAVTGSIAPAPGLADSLLPAPTTSSTTPGSTSSCPTTTGPASSTTR